MNLSEQALGAYNESNLVTTGQIKNLKNPKREILDKEGAIRLFKITDETLDKPMFTVVDLDNESEYAASHTFSESDAVKMFNKLVSEKLNNEEYEPVKTAQDLHDAVLNADPKSDDALADQNEAKVAVKVTAKNGDVISQNMRTDLFMKSVKEEFGRAGDFLKNYVDLYNKKNKEGNTAEIIYADFKNESEDDMTGAKEGVGGGREIGKTKSGKIVYASSYRTEHKGWSKQDYQDAHDLHDKHAKHHWKRMGNFVSSSSVPYGEHKAAADRYKEHIKKMGEDHKAVNESGNLEHIKKLETNLQNIKDRLSDAVKKKAELQKDKATSQRLKDQDGLISWLKSRIATVEQTLKDYKTSTDHSKKSESLAQQVLESHRINESMKLISKIDFAKFPDIAVQDVKALQKLAELNPKAEFDVETMKGAIHLFALSVGFERGNENWYFHAPEVYAKGDTEPLFDAIKVFTEMEKVFSNWGGFSKLREAFTKKVESYGSDKFIESNSEYTSHADKDYIKKSMIDDLLNDVNAFNNISVTKKEGGSLVTHYVTGTRFAMDGVEKMLKEKNVPFTKNNTGAIQLTYEKHVNESKKEWVIKPYNSYPHKKGSYLVAQVEQGIKTHPEGYYTNQTIFPNKEDAQKFFDKVSKKSESINNGCTYDYNTNEAAKFDLGHGHLGNGITVWNKAKEEHGDYQMIAHIDPSRKISYRIKNPPQEVIDYVEAIAKGKNMGISTTQSDQKVFHESLANQVLEAYSPNESNHILRHADRIYAISPKTKKQIRLDVHDVRNTVEIADDDDNVLVTLHAPNKDEKHAIEELEKIGAIEKGSFHLWGKNESVSEAGGSGFGSFAKGAVIKDVNQVSLGELVTHGSAQFKAKNIARITKIDKEKGKLEAVFVNPKNVKELRNHDDKPFTIWDYELEGGEYHKAVPEKKSDKSLPLAKHKNESLAEIVIKKYAMNEDKAEKISKAKEQLSKWETSLKNAQEKLADSKKSGTTGVKDAEFWTDRVQVYTDEVKASKDFIAHLEKQEEAITNNVSFTESIPMSSGQRAALKIIHRVLSDGKHGGFAVDRQGIGTEYFKTEAEADKYAEEVKRKSGISTGVSILTKDSPVFKQAGVTSENFVTLKETDDEKSISPLADQALEAHNEDQLDKEIAVQKIASDLGVDIKSDFEAKYGRFSVWAENEKKAKEISDAFRKQGYATHVAGHDGAQVRISGKLLESLKESASYGGHDDILPEGEDLAVGDIEYHRFRDALKAVDVSNAGKRGKTVKELSLYKSGKSDDQTPIEAFISDSIMKLKHIDQVEQAFKELASTHKEEGWTVQVHTLKGVDVFRKLGNNIEINNGSLNLHAKPDNVAFSDAKDHQNAMAGYVRPERKTDLKKAWDLVQANKDKIEKMQYRDFLQFLNANEINYHTYAGMD